MHPHTIGFLLTREYSYSTPFHPPLVPSCMVSFLACSYCYVSCLNLALCSFPFPISHFLIPFLLSFRSKLTSSISCTTVDSTGVVETSFTSLTRQNYLRGTLDSSSMGTTYKYLRYPKLLADMMNRLFPALIYIIFIVFSLFLSFIIISLFPAHYLFTTK